MENTLTLTATAAISVNATTSQVWRALTTPKLIKQYLMGTDVTSDWKEGSAITYEGEYQGKKYHDKGIIKKIEPNKLFQNTYWSSMSGKEDVPENYKLVTYTISTKKHQTLVTITQENNANEKEKEHSTENWNTVLQKMKEVIESINS